MTTSERIPLTRLASLGLRVPAHARLDARADDDRLRREVAAALAMIAGPAGRRLGSRTDPLFVAVIGDDSAAPASASTFLGASAESLDWLDDRGGGAIAAAVRRRDFSDGAAAEPVEQIVRAARAQTGAGVTLLPMVLGCYRDGDGGGLIRLRDLSTGRAEANGFFVPGSCSSASQGDPAARPLSEFADRPWSVRLQELVGLLQAGHPEVAEIEFVVEDGQVCVVGATAATDAVAACAITAALVREGRLEPAEALERITADRFARALRPKDAGPPPDTVIGRGLGVSAGVAAGHATFDPVRVVELGRDGKPAVLIRTETRPEDLDALLAATAIVTIRGGRTSHAAVIARTIGRPCVVGLADARLNAGGAALDVNGMTIADGDLITVDGERGLLAFGAATAAGEATGPEPSPAARQLLTIAEEHRRLEVWANADTAAEAAAARGAGAAGIGLCRTEHMFLGGRQRLLAEILLRPNDRTAQEALRDLHRLQRNDFVAILEAMDGLPVTVRLLDPPRHEFLPDVNELSVRTAVAAALGSPDADAEARLRAVTRLAERNPMLGVRGIRLGVLLPWLYEMQVTALVEASMARLRAGGDPRPMLLVPMVAMVEELHAIREFTDHLMDEACSLADREIALPVGVMIETPRAALTAGELAAAADFFSFGTNDLTQLTWGLSRDDTDAEVLRPYQDLGLIDASPFERLDRAGVGQLIQMAVRSGRAARAGLKLGVCGEHAGDPDSIQAFHDWGLDYVSCSPPQVALARYAAGRAARHTPSHPSDHESHA